MGVVLDPSLQQRHLPLVDVPALTVDGEQPAGEALGDTVAHPDHAGTPQCPGHHCGVRRGATQVCHHCDGRDHAVDVVGAGGGADEHDRLALGRPTLGLVRVDDTDT